MLAIVRTLFWGALLLCTGCFDITEELWLNKNRSGRFEMSVSMTSGPFMSMLRMAQDKTNDSLSALGLPPRSVDTLVRLGDLPDSLKRRFPHPEVLAGIVLRAKMDKGFQFRFQYDFQRIEDLPLFWEALNTLDQLKKDSTIRDLDALKVPGMEGSSGMMAGLPDIQYDGKTLRRTTLPDSTNQESGLSLFGDENDPFLKMMFRDKKYRLVFHLPKKVKTVEGAGFTTDGKDVTGEFLLLDVVRDRTKLSCAISTK